MQCVQNCTRWFIFNGRAIYINLNSPSAWIGVKYGWIIHWHWLINSGAIDQAVLQASKSILFFYVRLFNMLFKFFRRPPFSIPGFFLLFYSFFFVIWWSMFICNFFTFPPIYCRICTCSGTGLIFQYWDCSMLYNMKAWYCNTLCLLVTIAVTNYTLHVYIQRVQ